MPDSPSSLTDAFSRVVETQPEPPSGVVLAAAAVALLAVLSRRAWPLARTVITIAHEGGHAVAAVLARRRLRGIRLHSDTSGLTVSHGRPSGPGMVFTAASGYVAPSLLGDPARGVAQFRLPRSLRDRVAQRRPADLEALRELVLGRQALPLGEDAEADRRRQVLDAGLERVALAHRP